MMNNFGRANLENCREILHKKKESGNFKKEAYTMIQVNEPCAVNISAASRRKCASAIVK